MAASPLVGRRLCDCFIMLLLLLFPFLFLSTAAVAVVSSSPSYDCLAAYNEGGAPAVFASSECAQWTDTSMADHPVLVRSSPGCHPTVLQGRRHHMEDRTVCALDIPVPFLGLAGGGEINSSLIAVFDGHGGAEASELSSRLLVEYFLLHLHFLTDSMHPLSFKSQSGRLLNWNYRYLLSFDPEHSDAYDSKSMSDKSFQKEILRESLLRTIHDIDKAFTEEAYKNGYISGSTASVVLIADGQIFVAYVGDSKAFLCSKGSISPDHVEGWLHDSTQPRKHDAVPFFYPKELTKDHHPDREDEKARVKAAGGRVILRFGVPRVNGELALSRAIGDLPYKRYGVIPVPEVTDWQPLSKNDSYLVVATDGVFERMTTMDVCKLLWDVPMDMDDSSLGEYIVNAAYKGGSTDNLSTIVIPLAKTHEKCEQGFCSFVKPEVPELETNSEMEDIALEREPAEAKEDLSEL